MCINSYTTHPISDNNLYCYMIKYTLTDSSITIDNLIASSFPIIEEIKDGIDFCQIQKLSTSNYYAAICLSYYYRTTYYLTVFKFDNNAIELYNDNYKNIQFSLLCETPISITYFENDAFGIFFRDIDNDSTILMFYPRCGYQFDLFPRKIENDCLDINTASTPILTSTRNYYFDECTHSYNIMLSNFSNYERNQFCKIKKIVCNNGDGYYLDDYNSFGTYECWNKNLLPQKIFFDEVNRKFKKCFRSCLKCHNNAEGDENNNNCISCDEENGFFPFQDSRKVKQCHHKDEPIDKYFFDSENKIFLNCRKECLTCRIKSDLLDNEETNIGKDTKCLKCDIDNDFWPQVDNPSNCIKNISPIENYYPLSTYKSWERCFIGCKFCKELGENIYDTRCDLSRSDYCSDEYYKVEPTETITNNRANCFKGNVRYDRYYLDKSTNPYIFKKCNIACLQCDESGTDENTKCLRDKCDELNNYFPREDDHTICYKYNSEISSIDDLPMYYYFDPDKKIFRKCQEGCLYCKEQNYANENDTQCFEKCDLNNNFYMKTI